MSGEGFAATIHGHQEDSNGVTLYEIVVSGAGTTWTTKRRYKEFQELHEAIEHYNEILAPEARVTMHPMPPKSFFRRKFVPTFGQVRQYELQEVLNTALEADPGLSRLQKLRDFLEVPQDVLHSIQTGSAF